MQIIFTNGSDERFINLCHELDEYLNHAVGGEKQRKEYAQYNTLEKIHDVALVIEDGAAVACGGIKEYEPDTAEIKRVFTREGFRNRGYGKSIIRALEERAQNNGYSKLILETGLLLKEAISMYTALGFYVIRNYGPYASMTESVCMEKRLIR